MESTRSGQIHVLKSTADMVDDEDSGSNRSSKSSIQSVKPRRRDTRLKHSEDHSQDKNHTFKNMTEIHKMAGLKLPKSGHSVLVNAAKAWLNKHPELNVHGVKNAEDKKRCAPLVTYLGTTFRDYFADTDTKAIQKACYKVIQRALSNKRRNEKLKEKRTRMGTHRQEGQSQSTAVWSEVDDNSSVSSDDNNVNQAPGSKFKIESGNGFSPVDTKARTNFARGSPDANFVLSTTVEGLVSFSAPPLYERECTSIWLGGGPGSVGHHILTIDYKQSLADSMAWRSSCTI